MKTWNHHGRKKLIVGTLSILNGSIEKAWATRKTAAERMIIRDTMMMTTPKLNLNEHTWPHSSIYRITEWHSYLRLGAPELFFDYFGRVHTIILSFCCWGGETKKKQHQDRWILISTLPTGKSWSYITFVLYNCFAQRRKRQEWKKQRSKGKKGRVWVEMQMHNQKFVNRQVGWCCFKLSLCCQVGNKATQHEHKHVTCAICQNKKKRIKGAKENI